MTPTAYKVEMNKFIMIGKNNWRDMYMNLIDHKRKSNQFTCDESRESPVDPPTNDNHWENICKIAFHHVHHHGWI